MQHEGHAEHAEVLHRHKQGLHGHNQCGAGRATAGHSHVHGVDRRRGHAYQTAQHAPQRKHVAEWPVRVLAPPEVGRGHVVDHHGVPLQHVTGEHGVLASVGLVGAPRTGCVTTPRQGRLTLHVHRERPWRLWKHRSILGAAERVRTGNAGLWCHLVGDGGTHAYHTNPTVAYVYEPCPVESSCQFAFAPKRSTGVRKHVRFRATGVVHFTHSVAFHTPPTTQCTHHAPQGKKGCHVSLCLNAVVPYL